MRLLYRACNTRCVTNIIRYRSSNYYRGNHIRYFSNDDFKDTLNKVNKDYNNKRDNNENTAKESSTDNSNNNNKEGFQFSMPSIDSRKIINWGYDAIDVIRTNIELTYQEMVSPPKKESRLKRTVHQADSYRPSKKKVSEDDDDEDDMKEENIDGPSAIVLVKEPQGAWDAMKQRLQDSPFIKEILKNSRKVGKAASDSDIGKKAQDIGQSVKDKMEDAREVWETSQNPLVYTVHGIWENMTGETEEAIVTSAIKRLDPEFNKEEWSLEVKEELAPVIIKAHLSGDTKTLKPWLGEAVYNKLAADIRTRKHDGIVFDTNILDIEENQIILKILENNSPIIVVVYMVQQINCIKNRKGEIIEGGENDIRAKFYSMAFQQNYDEDDGTMEWKIVDYEFAGDMPYW